MGESKNINSSNRGYWPDALKFTSQFDEENSDILHLEQSIERYTDNLKSKQSFETSAQYFNANFEIEVLGSQVPKLQKTYDIYNGKKVFQKIQNWKGIVLEITTISFLARLIDLTAGGTDEIGEFELEDVSPDDIKLLHQGSIFYWSVGHYMENGQSVKRSDIRFQRLITLDMDDIESVKSQIEKKYSNLKEKRLNNKYPSENEVEVTLIGTGGGYGESILIKVGVDSWIIIDSCINPNSKVSLGIEYLMSIKANLENVELIICTHWHNDHIKGLAKTLELCKNAEFCFSSVNDLQKFLLLCELDFKKVEHGSIGSTTEFANCLEIVNRRGTYFTKASSNMVLLNKKFNNTDFVLYALSPSPKTVIDFDTEISQLITEFGERNTAVIKNTPNDKSVALLLKFGNNRVLLGADLSIGKDDNEGWRHIISYSKVIDEEKASLYKVPHHGSETSYLKEIFDILISEKNILKLTPYSSSGLPRQEMLDVYSGHSDSIYFTSRTNVSKKSKKRDKALEKVIDRSVKKLEEIKFIQGIVRSRINYLDPNDFWGTEVFDGAYQYK